MKKIISLALVLVMVFCITACGGNDVQQEGTTPPTITEPAAKTEKTSLSAPELAKLASPATVAVYADGSTGTGFFIDDQGTFVTCFHVIDGANEIRAGMHDGGSYEVKEIIDFSELYDIAVLKADITNTPYLDFNKNDVVQGETVYALGTSNGLEGTFSNGVISAISRKIGAIDCVQTNAAISSGNSGGPLLNEFGEVIGIVAYRYISGQNLNLAIDVDMLDHLTMDKNWNMNQFREWYAKETDRSYLVRSYDEINKEYDFYYSYIHTYHHVTGQPCFGSMKDWRLFEKNNMAGLVKEYRDDFGVYVYNYNVNEFDQYTDYLTSIGFKYVDSTNYENGVFYKYYNEYTDYTVNIGVMEAKNYIIIEPVY